MFKNRKRKSCSAGVLIQIYSLDNSQQSHGIQISHSFLWEKRTASELQLEVRGSHSSGVWNVCRSEIYFTPNAAPTGFTQVKPLQWAWLIFQSWCPQCSMMSSSASRVVAGRLTADGRRSCWGFPRTCRQPSAASVQAFCSHLLQPGSVLRLCWIVHKSGSLQFAGAVHVYSGSQSDLPHCVHPHLFKLCTASWINRISLVQRGDYNKLWLTAAATLHWCCVVFLDDKLYNITDDFSLGTCFFLYKAVSQLWHFGKW